MSECGDVVGSRRLVQWLTCVNLSCRTTGPHRGGHGPDQRRHEGGGKESDWDGEVLRDLRSAV